MTWQSKIMPDDALDSGSLVGVMLQEGEVGEITGDGSGEVLPDVQELGPAAENLAARPLLERLAAITISTPAVEVLVLRDRAKHWLAENPPGQPVAIEPRGCPIPGACACVQPEPTP